MGNEGTVLSGSAAELRTVMIKELDRLGSTGPDEWEQAVFTALTGARREDVDWDIEDNQAGYNLWIKAFDQLIQELIDDGFVRLEESSTDDERRFVLRDVDPTLSVDTLRESPVT